MASIATPAPDASDTSVQHQLPQPGAVVAPEHVATEVVVDDVNDLEPKLSV